MGLLKIHNDLIESQPDTVSIIFKWLQDECDAIIKPLINETDVYQYLVEGIDIPLGLKTFSLSIEKIFEGVLLISIT